MTTKWANRLLSAKGETTRAKNDTPPLLRKEVGGAETGTSLLSAKGERRESESDHERGESEIDRERGEGD